MTPPRPILVAGAGIGGLTAALSLARQGYEVILAEKAAVLEEAGAGLQLSPNASRVLIDLGLGPALGARATLPETLIVARARTGDIIVRMPLNARAGASGDAPYWVIHRADLQAVLAEAVLAEPAIALRLGWQFEAVAATSDGLTVSLRRDIERLQEQALALIGADGVWSSVRQTVDPARRPRFSGMIAWRGTLDAGDVPREFSDNAVRLWLGPDAHVIAYPVSNGRRINLVVITPDEWNRPGWSEPGDRDAIIARFSGPRRAAALRLLIGAVETWRRWALFAVDDGPWSGGAVALLGDAAHAMLPFAAQGAGMAIEDAAVLAQTLGPAGRQDADVAAALAEYERRRRGRVRRVQRAAVINGRIYHLAGPLALARDLAMRALGPERLMARYDWIYDWRV